jgi:tetratricopeptide (TPR) repeat protein
MVQWNFDGEELLALARLDIQKGTTDQGLSKLKQGLESADCPVEAHLEIARVYAQLGLREKARRHFQSYLHSRPDDVDATFQFGMVHFEDSQTDAALELWSNVLRRQAQYPPALFFSALATAKRGQVAEAKAMLRTTMESIPADNLYFTRSRDLLTSLEDGGRTGPLDAALLSGEIRH